ncbi:EamA family transporter [Kovacikia minuta CCNUW1]|uniref:EamA family transporter n=1 Tax=Kovacikia minuta TaxID=2931930 RepID=UPI001CCA0979|nr:EamA family transporter [Kovacikia minuta]UBF24064.1 EamA family transporter [Kovacikia minuta CCNUW1]
MGQLGDRSETGIEDARTVEKILQTVSQDLKSLHQGLIVQLSQEVTRLQAEKSRLMSDIEKLQAYHRALQSRQLESLSQQQSAQQQLWAKQLAQILAVHLQAQIMERLNQIAVPQQASVNPAASPTAISAANGYSENAHRLLASLDTTFSNTFKTLQQELDSYQSSLSQQISRMHSLEQQGETILEALITRLREQLQAESMDFSGSAPTVLRGDSNSTTETRYPSAVEENYPSSEPPYPSASPRDSYSVPSQFDNLDDPRNGSPAHLVDDNRTQLRDSQDLPQTATPIPLEFPGAPLPLPKKAKREISHFQLGLALVLLSTVALSVHNVVVRIIGNESTVLRSFQLGGVINITSLGNSLLILWLRMLVVLPLMIPVAMFLYPAVWRDIKRFTSNPDRGPLFNVLGSGFFLFLSQILIYIAIGKIGAGPAVTILFMYPIVTVPLAWFLFGDRPTTLRWIVMGTISLGVILTALPNSSLSSNATGAGVMTAVLAGIAFALYLVFMQLGFKKLHPIPVSLVQFFTIFVLTSLILTLSPVDLGVQVTDPQGFFWGGVILGALTLVGYLANNFGVRFMGAARASIIASSGPVMTAFLAWLIIQSPLQWVQIIGILLVTGGVTALSFERMKGQPPPAKLAPTNGRK